jgi:hypothetical protein
MAKSRQEEIEGTYLHAIREKCMSDFGQMSGRHEGIVKNQT